LHPDRQVLDIPPSSTSDSGHTREAGAGLRWSRSQLLSRGYLHGAECSPGGHMRLCRDDSSRPRLPEDIPEIDDHHHRDDKGRLIAVRPS
jgi:hypothetical protein